MRRRLIILTLIIVTALSGLTILGYHAIEKWAQGLEWKRLGDFADVAEQIRLDVKRKLDKFIEREENRPYTQYQYFYVPENIANNEFITNNMSQTPILRSPLAGRMENSLAYGYFQLEPEGQIITANRYILQIEGQKSRNWKISQQDDQLRQNLKKNLMPALARVEKKALLTEKVKIKNALKEQELLEQEKSTKKSKATETTGKVAKVQEQQKSLRRAGKGVRQRSANLNIETLQSPDREAQVTRQQRVIADNTTWSNAAVAQGAGVLFQSDSNNNTTLNYQPSLEALSQETQRPSRLRASAREESIEKQQPAEQDSQTIYLWAQQAEQAEQAGQSDTILVRIEPFVPFVVGGEEAENSIFGGQVFLLRHVQVAEKHLRQGFKLNEKKLIEEVSESASRLMREGMSFELPQIKDKQALNQNPAYQAVLDFGFGDLILNLNETSPGWIAQETSQLRHWYFGIVAVVFAAAILGLVSLWRYALAQVKLAEKKDDFISAVSHELRTPLTTIRMYSEMLENKWVKSKEKSAEYYKGMRQETERLSRLIENVLDFSRIQKCRKKYTFNLGNLNKCISEVVAMMRPYAAQHNFTIKTELEELNQASFDKDSVKQIVVNLIDNAVKYARKATDKSIIVRTRRDSRFVLIEVEDHGPGVPRRQKKKIFEQFYRTEAEATRETAGTGLGLALVKRFAQAHNGFVEILAAKPNGSIFRVALAIQN